MKTDKSGHKISRLDHENYAFIGQKVAGLVHQFAK